MQNVMTLSPSTSDICLRLALTVLFGAAIGINRQTGGHAAGVRTTVLVGLAACLTMIQANLLLDVSGKTPQSFAQMDTLRLPLGILTGVGFIGGGAILKRGDLVTGVTTAATLWIMTTIGLCFGGGQLAVGGAAGVIALIVLSPMKMLDARLPRKQKALVTIDVGTDARPPDINAMAKPLGCKARYMGQERNSSEGTKVTFELVWTGTSHEAKTQEILTAIEHHHRIDRFELLNPSA